MFIATEKKRLRFGSAVVDVVTKADVLLRVREFYEATVHRLR